MKLIILGAGGHARETYCHIQDINPKVEILFFDDMTHTSEIKIKGKTINVLKSWDEAKAQIKNGFETFTIGIGNPRHKINFIKNALNAGLKPHQTWIHPRALVQDATIGLGGMIAPGVVVTCSVTIGDYVVLNYNMTVGHDAVIGTFSTCNPGSTISGNVTIGECCLIGAGAVVREKISIASNTIVGAQACVVKDITVENLTVAGVPSKTL